MIVAIESQNMNQDREFMGSKLLKKHPRRSGKRHYHRRRHHHHHAHHHVSDRRKYCTTKTASVSLITALNSSMVKCRRRLVKFFSKIARAIIPECDCRPALGFQVLQNPPMEYLENQSGPPKFDFEFDTGIVPPHHLVVNRRLLPPLATEGKKTIVLDLDETLIHSSPDRPPKSYDFVVRPEIEGKTVTMHVLKRPGLDEFLKELSEKFEVVVFTAGLKPYASLVLDNLDPEGKIFTHRLYREACKEIRGRYVKDLSELGRDLGEVVIVDDNPKSYSLQPGNAIPMKAFVDNMEDRELEKLMVFFRQCSVFRDIREAVRQYLSHLAGDGDNK
ncbi:hypothetical protein SLE2022_388520 [Rubroshorea leprosula]